MMHETNGEIGIFINFSTGETKVYPDGQIPYEKIAEIAFRGLTNPPPKAITRTTPVILADFRLQKEEENN